MGSSLGLPETTILYIILGLYWDNGKENGNYWDYSGSIRILGYILGLYWDNGKENGNYYNGDYIGSM